MSETSIYLISAIFIFGIGIWVFYTMITSKILYIKIVSAIVLGHAVVISYVGITEFLKNIM